MTNGNANCLFCENKSVCFKELTDNELAQVEDNRVEISYKKDAKETRGNEKSKRKSKS